jgi:hypothetical protein
VIEPNSPQPPAPQPDPFANLGEEGAVSAVLQRAAYFPLFSVHNPSVQNVPLSSPEDPRQLIGMKVFEQMHRFAIQVKRPLHGRGLDVVNRVGQPVAEIQIDWRVIPDDFVAAPDRLPPPTALDPTRSQRFAMYDGQFRWNDPAHSTFHGFGAGRTFPTVEAGKPQLRIGAVVDILSGTGRLAGAVGNAVVNGFITPPYDLALGIMLRFVDPAGRLRTRAAPVPLEPIPDPDPTAVFLTFLGEADPERPITLEMAPGGRVTGASVHELLRLVRIDFDVGTAKGMRSRTLTGPIAGTLRFSLRLDSGFAGVPLPFTTHDGVFTFFAADGEPLGTLTANAVEGRAFPAEVPGAPQPVLRVAGVGPVLGGAGIFAGAAGMLSLNGIISIPARTPSILYTLRLADPEGKLRRGLCALDRDLETERKTR